MTSNSKSSSTTTRSNQGGKGQRQTKEMVINYVPGEECRVALVEGGRLEEFHAERMDNASHVGNIYVGKVLNVEAGIQAAFVDFGLEANGFLHVTDLHPRYFPGEDNETTERVGKKTPRRERPPIQACLKRGQEIAVQVLKEGVGSKGPTVTSYLSIPGRFLVMMPLMDKVGVSRKVEDEEQRRKMREILDQLDLPEGFGFILRTAGMDQNKTELKRDLAYLQRLWKDMEKRWKTGSKPRLLYSESDLLVRALRDMLSSDVDRIVVDNESAVNRAARFLKIVAPRTTTKLVRYTGKTPIYHAMGIEPQIQTIHAREVPLQSGGRLVIDETEALVAIDVNSGRMRDAKDAETTAYRTNMEAADEIARQLRLRDVGGVIVNDFIDMRSLKHRRELEQRFKENLKKDRARTTTATVSPFGVIEMTRQRMRGSHESQHFATCPSCRGRGLLQRPDSVAADALRELTALLDHERVYRVEMVVHPRIAGELLSTKRRSLSRVERTMAKKVDVRVSDAIAVDRVTFYAYDERGADIDAAKLEVRKLDVDLLQPFVAPDSADWAMDLEQEAEPEPDEAVHEQVIEPLHPIEMDDAAVAEQEKIEQEQAEAKGGRRRRRRGGRGRGGKDRATASQAAADKSADRDADRDVDKPTAAGPLRLVGDDEEVGEAVGSTEAQASASGEAGTGRKRRRRRRRGGKGAEGSAVGAEAGGPDTDSTASDDDSEADVQQRPEHAEVSAEDGEEGGAQGDGRRRRRRRRRGGRGRGGEGEAGGERTGEQAGERSAKPATEDRAVKAESSPDQSGEKAAGEGGERRKRRRRRGGRGRRDGASGESTGGSAGGTNNGTARTSNAAPSSPAASQQPSTPPVQVRPRSLYSVGRRKLTPAERKNLGGGDE
ncbi:MAG: Rne/Rng family ribonuclease [Phycisphaeraceae bacterium]|nr:Rne/Rng family ribonuclease [Phycisphaeraceae bacterium]